MCLRGSFLNVEKVLCSTVGLDIILQEWNIAGILLKLRMLFHVIMKVIKNLDTLTVCKIMVRVCVSMKRLKRLFPI